MVDIDGNPWFVGVDCTMVLGLQPSAYRQIDRSEQSKLPRTQLGLRSGPDMTILSESGLFKLVLRSDKPEAKPFQDWVTKVVLPAIRKDGAYVMGEEKAPSS